MIFRDFWICLIEVGSGLLSVTSLLLLVPSASCSLQWYTNFVTERSGTAKHSYLFGLQF